METVTITSPAKINLSLAITGRRADGFHELISVVAPLVFGDTLHARRVADGAGFSLTCEVAEVPVDESNLVLRAGRLFAAETGWDGGVAFALEKRIPMGAGLGGGSSNAVAALRALEQLSGRELAAGRRDAVAAELGSDCPLFWRERPVVMRGRGERVEVLTDAGARRLRGRKLVVFKPGFGVATAWAYQALAAIPGAYAMASAEEARLAAWLSDDEAQAEKLLLNTIERPVFAKWVALPAMLAWLRERHGLEGRMSGSGSACFAFLPEGADIVAVTHTVREGWGEEAFVQATEIA